MATSGSYDYNQTRNEIITDALQLIGVIGEGQTATANALTFGSSLLNKMIKSWEAQGFQLFTQEEGAVYITTGINKYNLALSNGDRFGRNPIDTTLAAIASSGTTSVTVASTTGMTVGDAVGISQDNDTISWSTISSLTTTSITFADATSNVAASGNSVYTYNSAGGRPLNIHNCRYKYGSGGTERRMMKMGRTQFMQLPNKSTQSPPTAFYFAPHTSNSSFYVWPTPTETNDVLYISYNRSIQDFDTSTDNPDLPQEWLEALTFNLAMRLAPAYGISLSRVNPDIIAIARESLNQLRSWDSEEGSIKIVPNNRWDD